MIASTLDKPELHAGVRFGLLALGLAILVGLVWRLVLRRGPAPVAGLLGAGAFALGLRDSLNLPTRLWQGLALLAAAGLVASALGRLAPPLRLAGPVLALPGAWLVATRTGLVDVTWVRALVVVSATVGGSFVADFDHHHRTRGYGPVAMSVSVVGVYFCVPDTERALVLLGAIVFLLLAAWPWVLTAIGGPGAYAAAGALAWTAALEGRGRLAAVVGGVACLGLLVAEPVARLLSPGRKSVLDRLPRQWWSAVALGLLQLAVVFVASRVAGILHDVRQASIIAVADLSAAVLVLAMAPRVMRGESAA